MADSKDRGSGERLRQRAEELLHKNPRSWRETDHRDVLHLVHELQVHQIELEMQNDELRRTQEALEASRRRYFELYDMAPVGYLTLSPQGRILEANLTACELLGLSRREILGKNLLDFTAPPDWEHLQRHLHDLGLEGNHGRLACELAVNRPDGGRLHVFLESLKVENGGSGSEAVQIRTTLSDVTPLVQARQALQASRDQLEIRIQERTSTLSRTAADLTERNQELQDFAFIASHDLKEPLRKIQTFGDLVLTRHAAGLDGTARDYLQRMRQSARRMGEMLDGLLDYSRVGSRGASFTAVNLGTVLEEAAAVLEYHIEKTGARLEWKDLPVIEADHSQMIQLFQNLLGNALKYRRRGVTPEIRIHAEEFTRRNSNPAGGKPRPWCQIFVADNGIGIEEKYFKRIFTPFERLHGRAAFEGTGMGLSICQKIAQRHGGSIAVRKNTAGGSTFFVTLPLRQPAAEGAGDETPPKA